MSISFVAFGKDVVGNPILTTQDGVGQDGAGQVSLQGGTQPFSNTQVLKFSVENVSDSGELTAQSQILCIQVYETVADYAAGNALYTYDLTDGVDGIPIPHDLQSHGDTYLKFDAGNLVTSQPGAPDLGELFVAPGTLANANYGSLTIDRDTDVDYSGDGTIQPDTIEEGNTFFNIKYSAKVYDSLPDGVVTGQDTGEEMRLGYVDQFDGDVITTGADQIEGMDGDDTIDGDAGNDGVVGGGGDDLLTGGAGHDWVIGEGGDDTLVIADDWGNDQLIGGETGETEGDTLDASAVTADLTVDLSGTDPEAGSISDGTNTAQFQEIESLILGSGEDTVALGDGVGARSVEGFTGPTDNGDGTYTGVDMLDVTGLTNGAGDPVTTDDVTVSDDGDGNAVLTFDTGESVKLTGIAPADLGSQAALVAIGIPAGQSEEPGLDYIVSGDEDDNTIDDWYTGDPQGDRIDAGDARDGSDDDHVQAGAGNDTVLSGLGDDLVEGGAGLDRLEGGEGDDTLLGQDDNDKIWGGDGDDSILGGDGADTIEGNYGADHIDGGEGDDSIYGDTGDDTLFGGAGDDWLRGSVGYDSMSGGTGDDYIWSGYQDDTITLEDNFGNDTIEMEDIDETNGDVLDASAVTSNLTVDLREATSGVGTLSDGTSTASFQGVEHLILGSGDHTIVLGQTSGVDAIQGFTAPTSNPDGSYDGTDVLNLTNMVNDDGDLIDTDDVTVTDDGQGNAVLGFPGGESLKLVGISPAQLPDAAALNAIGIPLPPQGPGSDGVVEGTGGDDLIDTAYTGDPQGDMVDSPDGDDDSIRAGDGNDTILAGAGNDTIDGGAGADQIQGGTGDDQISGGEGNDAIDMGRGDTARGDGGDDTFNVGAQGGGHMVLDGGETGEVLGDTLNVFGPATIDYDPEDAENGAVSWQDGSTLEFSNIETVNYVPCFTPSTLIKTRRGEVPAGLLQLGDQVLTRDNGFQPVDWIGTRALTPADLDLAPSLRPVLIRKDALGPGHPERDMLVSPQHRMLISDRRVALWFNEPEVFVPAVALTCLPGIRQVRSAGTTYVHFMMQRHQVVMGDGAWSESFQPGDMTLAGMDQSQRQELLQLFPNLCDGAPSRIYPAARITLTGKEARLLAG